MTRFSAMPLQERRQPFSHSDWLYEVKHDGFRALAMIKDGQCRLLSRNGNDLKRFASLMAVLAGELRATEAVLDGVCLDPKDAVPSLRICLRIGLSRISMRLICCP